MIHLLNIKFRYYRDSRYSQEHTGKTPPTLARGWGGEGREGKRVTDEISEIWHTFNDKCSGGEKRGGEVFGGGEGNGSRLKS